MRKLLMEGEGKTLGEEQRGNIKLCRDATTLKSDCVLSVRDITKPR
jgi:hypothetical protein